MKDKEKQKKEDIEKCVECGEDMYEDAVDDFGQRLVIGGYCDNKKCKRYNLLSR